MQLSIWLYPKIVIMALERKSSAICKVSLHILSVPDCIARKFPFLKVNLIFCRLSSGIYWNAFLHSTLVPSWRLVWAMERFSKYQFHCSYNMLIYLTFWWKLIILNACEDLLPISSTMIRIVGVLSDQNACLSNHYGFLFRHIKYRVPGECSMTQSMTQSSGWRFT